MDKVVLLSILLWAGLLLTSFKSIGAEFMVESNIINVACNYDVLLVDIYGVLFDGAGIRPESLKHLEQLKKDGKSIYLCSNTTKSGDKCIEDYRKKGLLQYKHFDDIISSGSVMQQKAKNKKIKQIFIRNNEISAEDSTDPEYVYIGIPRCNKEDVPLDDLYLDDGSKVSFESLFDSDWNKIRNSRGVYVLQEMYNTLFEHRHLTALCANPDLFAFEVVNGHKKPVIRQGAMAKMFELIGGRVIYTGKPYQEIYEYIYKTYPEIKDKKVLMVGDTPWTDIAGANNFGIDSAMTLTGSYQFYLQEKNIEHSNDNLFSFINDYLSGIYGSSCNLTPKYYIKEF